MTKCEECGSEIDMPYSCNHCDLKFCSKHRLPENHACTYEKPDLDSTDNSNSAPLSFPNLPQLSLVPSSLRGNMTYFFLGLMWFMFGLQFILFPLVIGIDVGSDLWYQVFTTSTEHPLFVWTWITAIFSHGGFFHIVANSFVIFFFGRLLEKYLGSEKFTLLFILSGVLAGLGQVGIALIAGGQSYVLGASGAGLAILGALTVLRPDLKVYLYFILPIPIWLVTAGFAVYSIIAISSGGAGAGGVAQVAHLIGLVIGLIVGKRANGNISIGENYKLGGGRRRF